MSTSPLKTIVVPLVLGAVAIALVVGTPIWALRQEQKARITLERENTKLQAAFDGFRGKVQENSDKAKALASDTQKKLTTEYKAIEDQKNAQISDLERRVSVLAGELRKRPSRQDATPAGAGDSGSGAGQTQLYCTGAQLFGEDSEFLVGEAAAAETMRQELIACEGKLNTTSQATKSLKDSGIFFAR